MDNLIIKSLVAILDDCDALFANILKTLAHGEIPKVTCSFPSLHLSVDRDRAT